MYFHLLKIEYISLVNICVIHNNFKADVVSINVNLYAFKYSEPLKSFKVQLGIDRPNTNTNPLTDERFSIDLDPLGEAGSHD